MACNFCMHHAVEEWGTGDDSLMFCTSSDNDTLLVEYRHETDVLNIDIYGAMPIKYCPLCGEDLSKIDNSFYKKEI